MDKIKVTMREIKDMSEDISDPNILSCESVYGCKNTYVTYRFQFESVLKMPIEILEKNRVIKEAFNCKKQALYDKAVKLAFKHILDKED